MWEKFKGIFKMRKVFLLITITLIILLSSKGYAQEYDLEISVIVKDDLIAGESNEYKLFIENLDYETGQEEINAEIEYWIKKDGEILASYPKTTKADFKKQRTIKRTYKFREGGEHEICAEIKEINYPDLKEDNNLVCLKVEVKGEEKESEEERIEEEEEPKEEEEEELKEIIKEEEVKKNSSFNENTKTPTPTITGQTTREYKSKEQNLKPVFIGFFVVLCISLILIIIFKKSKI